MFGKAGDSSLGATASFPASTSPASVLISVEPVHSPYSSRQSKACSRYTFISKVFLRSGLKIFSCGMATYVKSNYPALPIGLPFLKRLELQHFFVWKISKAGRAKPAIGMPIPHIQSPDPFKISRDFFLLHKRFLFGKNDSAILNYKSLQYILLLSPCMAG